jgi:hypothetical protein
MDAEAALVQRFADLIEGLPGSLCEDPSEVWHERVLARQLAEAAALPDPFEALDELDWLRTSRGAPMTCTPAGAATTSVSGDTSDTSEIDHVSERLQEQADGLLARIDDLEAERARLDGRIVDAYGDFRAVVAEQVAHLEGEFSPGLVSRRRRETATERAVNVDVAALDEITTMTAVPAGEAGRRMRLAVDAIRYAQLRDRLAAGSVSLQHAALIADEVSALAHAEGWDEADHDELLTVVVERVLAPMPDGHRPTHPQIRQRLTRALKALHDPGAAKARRERAATRRRLTAELTEDGMGVLALHLPAEQVVAVADRIEQLARSMRQAGDDRNLDQLRADLAAEALLRHRYGPCPIHETTVEAVPPGQTAERPAEHGVCGCAPVAPAASVWVVVPFEVAAGLSDAPCELPGHGWVSAEHARQIIAAPGSVWRWLAVDHLTGRALELGTDRYRPTPAMIEQVRALDGHCRGPGCTVDARRCDIDHHTAWPEGSTVVGNLGPLDRRRHHQPKTAGLTSCQPVGDPAQRGLRWRTLTGRDYVTYPKSWTEALRDPDPPAPPSPSPPGDEPPPF